MALSRFFSQPATSSTTVVGDVITKTIERAQTPGFNAGLDSLQVPNIVTGPANSSTAASITFGTPIQNTLGYDAVINSYVNVTAASVASFAQGVGSSSVGVPTTTLVTGTSATGYYDFTAYVPAGYWFALNATQANGLSISASVNSQWQPV